MAIYHSAMAHIIPEINEICSKNDYEICSKNDYGLLTSSYARTAVFGIFCAWMVRKLQVQPCVAPITVLRVNVPRQSFTTQRTLISSDTLNPSEKR